MATYVDEEEVWKCPKHPSKRRRNGVCPTCLRERLVSLCPDCGHIRPCPCAAAAATTSSSSSDGGGEPSLRRSRSLAIPILRVKTASFLSGLMRSKTKRKEEEIVAVDEKQDKIQEFSRMVTRSRSVSAATATGSRRPYGDGGSSTAKSKFWNFATPLKAFRSSKTKQKIVLQDRSPLKRG